MELDVFDAILSSNAARNWWNLLTSPSKHCSCGLGRAMASNSRLVSWAELKAQGAAAASMALVGRGSGGNGPLDADEVVTAVLGNAKGSAAAVDVTKGLDNAVQDEVVTETGEDAVKDEVVAVADDEDTTGFASGEKGTSFDESPVA